MHQPYVLFINIKLITGRMGGGGVLQDGRGGGASEVLPLRKGGGGVLAMLKGGGGHNKFWGSFYTF